MNARRIALITIIALAGLLLIGLAGCKKEEEPAAPPAAPSAADIEAVAAAAAESVEQTTCPIMGAKIDKSIYTEYKGKKVYFCCAGCKEKFEAAPEDYLVKLPQFKQ